jgi:hypothetical protein
MKPQTLTINCTEQVANELKEEYANTKALCFGDKMLGHFEIVYMFVSPCSSISTYDHSKRSVMINLVQIEEGNV